ncbi:hypothetical protein Tco_1085544 [Tanacetum coccineum]
MENTNPMILLFIMGHFIQVTNVLLIDADVSKALVDYVSENEIENLVLGASKRSGITRSATISQRSVPDMIMPHKRDAYETPSPVYFGSADLVGHDLDVNFVGHANKNRTSASLSPIDLEAEMRRLNLS